MTKRSSANHRFKMQLLSDKSVVLVEVTGYESEIFLPQIQHDRIALVNIIHNRQLSSKYGLAASNSKFAAIRSSNSGFRVHNSRIRPIRKITTGSAGKAPGMLNVSSLRFNLKLISNGNVVLAECNGFESEIFLPHICGHCVTMKRVTASELVQCSRLRSKEAKDETAMLATASLLHDNKVVLVNLASPLHNNSNAFVANAPNPRALLKQKRLQHQLHQQQLQQHQQHQQQQQQQQQQPQRRWQSPPQKQPQPLASASASGAGGMVGLNAAGAAGDQRCVAGRSRK
ncbi:ras-interacting protein RIP3 [Scaptodrosophila lebanonensis]|uniref:Ras-interacting protein RIP3 n=1 Tax=Drosophila lebanonensis TaxID=7225 RepID=A0A6J2TBE3_DROLE|nr:ras-interacting protein RIP3 [Scaptodrosophila lebanonensis]